MPTVISLTDISKWYGDFQALDGISLNVAEGERVVL